MMKLAFGFLGSIFIGALFLEILRRKNPAAAQEIERRAKKVVGAVFTEDAGAHAR